MNDKKKCSKCGVIKSFNEFSKHNQKKDGLTPQCKQCLNEQQVEYRKTFPGVVSVIYNNQKRNSKRRGHNPPNYSLDELREWIKSRINFQELWYNWVESDYNTLLKPSCDRKKDNLPYTFSNLQLMTWLQNNNKASTDMRSGKLIVTANPQKPVIQLTLDGEIVNSFISIAEASRVTGISNAEIAIVCRGDRNRKKAGGFKWRFNSPLIV